MIDSIKEINKILSQAKSINSKLMFQHKLPTEKAMNYFEEADILLNEAIRNYPTKAHFYRMKSDLKIYTMDYKEAYSLLEKAIELENKQKDKIQLLELSKHLEVNKPIYRKKSYLQQLEKSMLPFFKYHPNPMITGSIIESDEVCECCESKQGFIYKGSIYSRHNLSNICPWCIADGRAAEKYDASFNSFSINNAENDNSNVVPEKIYDEISSKTPGFSSFQEEDWQFHCNDGCEFHGLAQVKDLKKISDEEVKRLIEISYLDETEIEERKKGDEDSELDDFFKFVCRHCGEFKFMIDLD